MRRRLGLALVALCLVGPACSQDQAGFQDPGRELLGASAVACAGKPSTFATTGTLDQRLDHCRSAYEILNGTALATPTATTERICFYLCVASTAQWYSWEQDTKSCKCFAREGITSITTFPWGDLVYRAFGRIQACFPFCSVGVDSCSRCRTRKGGVMCVTNFGTRRCCCTPPSKVLIKRGRIEGCTKIDRQARELWEQQQQAMHPIFRAPRMY